MSHVFVLYAKSDHKFARQLAVQIEQRGIQVWPVPNAAPSPEDLENARVEGLESATHILGILPADDADITDLLPYCEQALAAKKHVLAIVYHQAAPIPDHLKKCRVIDFEGQFLLAFEELSDALKKTKASTRPLTVEHPPPISKPGLMPIRFPSERCWREDRLRVNYTLPIILTE
ncbi:MAG: TIR domain-containing protein, partial [Anaerolineae bacterium]|nr:TIR domain-containing protein [Anaerolineae bacterium]